MKNNRKNYMYFFILSDFFRQFQKGFLYAKFATKLSVVFNLISSDQINIIVLIVQYYIFCVRLLKIEITSSTHCCRKLETFHAISNFPIFRYLWHFILFFFLKIRESNIKITWRMNDCFPIYKITQFTNLLFILLHNFIIK